MGAGDEMPDALRQLGLEVTPLSPSDLEQGDLIQVRLSDGMVYKYAVSSKLLYESDDAPVQEIVGPTPKESVTLITCGGTFSSATHQYDKRLVVRAERIEEAPALPPPA